MGLPPLPLPLCGCGLSIQPSFSNSTIGRASSRFQTNCTRNQLSLIDTTLSTNRRFQTLPSEAALIFIERHSEPALGFRQLQSTLGSISRLHTHYNQTQLSFRLDTPSFRPDTQIQLSFRLLIQTRHSDPALLHFQTRPLPCFQTTTLTICPSSTSPPTSS